MLKLNTFKNGLRDAQPWPDPLQRSIAALSAVHDFVTSIDDLDSDGLAAPLQVLLAALIELHEGGKPELLKPRTVDHRPPAGIFPRLRRACAAAVMQRYMDVGQSRSSAAARTARKFGGQAKTISGWRDRLTGPLPSESWGEFFDRTEAESFQRMKALIAPEATSSADVDAIAERLARYYQESK